MGARRLDRRRLLKLGLLGIPATAALAGGGLTYLWAGADIDTAGKLSFTNRLAVPPLARSRRDGAGRRVFDLRIAPGRHRFRPGRPTATWGVNGAHLGPTLRATGGETVLLRVRNDLPEATSLHWHGMRLPAAMDGGPHQPIEPGHTWSPTWRIDQPAATLWYHPHPHGRTTRHAYRGVAGLFIVDEPPPEPTAPSAPTGSSTPTKLRRLPDRYGVDDIPVIVQDKKFHADNQLDESGPTMSGAGPVGDTVSVNGTLTPYFDVTTQRVRLRLLNASSTRVYRFGLDDDRPFSLVATDGGLLAEPYRTNRVQLSPGERAEIVLAPAPGERLVLRSHPPRLGLDPWNRRFAGGDDTLDILQLRAAPRLKPSAALPERLADVPRIDTSAVAATRTFALSGNRINGRGMDMARIDFAVTQDTTEIWEITADDGVPHNFHVHDAQFQILSIDGTPPPESLRGWKDTVHTPPNTPVRIALRFHGHTDRRTPYMYHCHLLTHEDQGLMGQFVVLAPGERPGGPHTHDAG
ncbi:Multicopper oxidase with three cupredoxin domains (includes cell division protein FtsP and spore coat protein CotA) [Streptomyces sp. 1222.2]|uniref:multicopper oxidase family protein n=1 Tax=Streptomyces sp. 1222.2 TaxID=1938833 RepID=UPI000BDD4E2D|nr:multicopper oxidase domain-containing protein [Streptomyces sp. 1222.2]SOD72670.1 Multicopper oxidase with three cupredoxin domains (includes cell division protein FtsP and spore coat protein CotA) [Streptomyces sp. 1222.2]